MNDIFLAAAIFIPVMTGLGLVRLLIGPGIVDRIMVVQLLGTGGAAVLLLLATVSGNEAIVDVALMLALLAAFAAATFYVWVTRSTSQGEDSQ
ncbi:sodium:proton antiporter [Aureimonas fodinaquatilis]|uniref:Sodium:proton antiporter n=1 Tax=Aureimonas fodinaquatilis TaxID=2565783 RepID=A0A5B0DYQ7_9HYPH|nr:monovalent cation/H+ antiporter complex subunit F [Aureimonas fodinaquatilis]KAA0971924.1 sodium:proton antiporter [Aureimonas fodinaquatilis]